MALYLNTNLSSLTALRAVQSASDSLDLSYERLSTGLRINSASDDPAGMQISNKLTSQLDSLDESNRVAQNAISYAQTAEGAMEEITEMLERIRTLAIESANGTMTDSDRDSLQQEVDQLNEEICRIAAKTTFGGQNLLDGSASVARFQISPEPNSVIEIDLRISYDTDGLAKLAAQYSGSYIGTTGYTYTQIFSYQVNGGGIDISSASNAEVVLAGIDGLINAIDQKRAELGAIQNRLESTIDNQTNIAENVTTARARIRDTDFAEEATNMTAQEILEEASVAILTQANTRPQIALQMLENSL